MSESMQQKIEQAKQQLGDRYLLAKKVERVTPANIQVVYLPGRGLVKIAA